MTALMKNTDSIGKVLKTTRRIKISNGIMETTGEKSMWASYDEMIKAFEPSFKAMGIK